MNAAPAARRRPVLAFLLAPLAVPSVCLVIALLVIVANGEAAQLAHRMTWLFLAGLAVLGGGSAYVFAILIGWPIYAVLRRRGCLRRAPIVWCSAALGILGILTFWRIAVGATQAAWAPYVLLGAGGVSGGAAGWLFWRIVAPAG